MKKRITLFFIVSILITTINLQTATAQSWNISGNNNATSSSKLGTTNLVPLKFFTSNKQRMIIDSLGRIGINTNTPLNILTVKSSGGIPAASWLNGLNKPVFIGFADAMSSEHVLSAASNISVERAVFQGRRSRGTLVTPLAVANNDYITSLLASAYDGSTFQNPALVSFFVDGTPSSGNVPTRISFVTGSNAGNRTERLKVGSTGNFDFNNGQLFLRQADGNLGIGNASPIGRLHINVNGYNAYQGLVITNTNAGGKTLTINQGTSGKLNFTEPGILDLMTMDFTTGNVGIGTNDPGNYKLKISVPDDGGAYGGYGFDIENASSLHHWEFYIHPVAGNLFLFFNGNLRGSFDPDGSYHQVSDERLKTNIKPMATMLNKINQLKPSTYQFKNTRDGQEHSGFIAQDVMKIFPGMVNHAVIPNREVDVYTLDYSGFGVLAIKGIQELTPIIEEQRKINEEQKEEIKTLKDRISKLEAVLATIITNKNGNISSLITSATLEQNIPNPFTHNTTIGYSLPENFINAKIRITDKNGKILKTVNISGAGKGTLNVDAAVLSSGAYNYSLFVNGILVSTRQMERLK